MFSEDDADIKGGFVYHKKYSLEQWNLELNNYVFLGITKQLKVSKFI